MNSFQLMEGIGEIDSRFLEEAETYRKKPARRVWIHGLSAAACLAIAVSGGIFYTRLTQVEVQDQETASQAAAAPDQAPANAAAPFLSRVSESPQLYTAGGISYQPVTEESTQKQNGLPAAVPDDAVGEPVEILEDGSSICAYLPLEDVPAVRVLAVPGQANQFLLYHGGADGLTLGELYGFSGADDVTEISAGGTGIPNDARQELAATLAAASPDPAFTPGTEATLPQISIGLENGLSFSLHYSEEGQFFQLFDLCYPADETTAALMLQIIE